MNVYVDRKGPSSRCRSLEMKMLSFASMVTAAQRGCQPPSGVFCLSFSLQSYYRYKSQGSCVFCTFEELGPHRPPVGNASLAPVSKERNVVGKAGVRLGELTWWPPSLELQHTPTRGPTEALALHGAPILVL